MEPPEIEDYQAEMMAYANDCDEAMCVSSAGSDLYSGSFTCYGVSDGFGALLFPMKCADGYLPTIVEDEPPKNVSLPFHLGIIPASYFTCCPPRLPTPDRYPSLSLPNTNSSDDDGGGDDDSNSYITRRCSDPIATSWGCENETRIDRRHPRPMKEHRVQDSFLTVGMESSMLCCDSPAESTDFLEETECVPYRNPFYESTVAMNQVGRLLAISCDFSEADEEGLQRFCVPRPIPGGMSGQYQCCKKHGTETEAALPPFLQDSAFRTTVYLPLILWCIAATISAILVVGLLIPLFLQLRDGTFHRVSAYSRSSSASSSRRRTGSILGPSRRRTGSSSSVRARYSTYNLYVVYLALLDLVYALVMIGWNGGAIHQTFSPTFHGLFMYTSIVVFNTYGPDACISIPYALANMCINAIISHQVLLLLQSSHRRSRIQQPSLTRVNGQAASVFVTAAIYGGVYYFLWTSIQTAGNRREFVRMQQLLIAFNVLILVYYVLVFAAIGYVVYVAVVIWWKGYIPSWNGAMAQQRAMRQLCFYFARIIAIFLGIWIPTVVLIFYGLSSGDGVALVWMFCLVAIQPVLSFFVILTKSDMKKYIWDLVTLSYLCGVGKSPTPVDASPTRKNPDTSATKSATNKNDAGAESNIVGMVEDEADPGTNSATDTDTGPSEGDDEDDTESLIFSVLGFQRNSYVAHLSNVAEGTFTDPEQNDKPADAAKEEKGTDNVANSS